MPVPLRAYQENDISVKARRNTVRMFIRNTLRPWLDQYVWFVVVGLGVVVFGLGYIGFAKSFGATGHIQSPLNLVYYSLQLFVLQSGSIEPIIGWELEVARFLAPALTAVTFLSFLLMLFYRQYQGFCLRFVENHTIICGCGLLGSILSKKFLDLGYPVVVIEKNPDNEDLQVINRIGAFVITGDATNPAVLDQAGIRKANYLVSVMGDDGLNAEVAARAYACGKKMHNNLLSCFIHIVDPPLFNLLAATEIDTSIPEKFRMEIINLYKTAGKYILDLYPPFPKNSPAAPGTHILIIGVGRMGETLLVEACKRWMEEFGSEEKMTVSMMDSDPKRKEQVIAKHPSLETHCNLRVLEMEIGSPEFGKAAFLYGPHGEKDITQIYICVGDDVLGLSAALALCERMLNYDIPIVLRTNNERGIASLFTREESAVRHKYSNIRVFPLVSQASEIEYILNSTHEMIARQIHDEYCRLQKAKGAEPDAYPFMRLWEDLPEEIRESNRQQADDIIGKLTAVHCDIEMLNDWNAEPFEFSHVEVEMLAKGEHIRWMDERIRKGWIYAAKRDDIRKHHPSLIPWDELSEPEKEKDRNAVRRIPMILRRAGFKIVPRNHR